MDPTDLMELIETYGPITGIELDELESARQGRDVYAVSHAEEYTSHLVG